MFLLLFLLFSPIFSFKYIDDPKLPIVLMHGILSNTERMYELRDYLESNFSLTVIVPEIGNGIPNSLNLPLDVQGDILCEELNKNTLLENGFNFIGVSQGGILGRYYIEKCGDYNINNLITLVSPHGGVYSRSIDNIIDVYGQFAREHYSFSSYWRDPYDFETYKNIVLLADLNNEVDIDDNNRDRFTSINNFIMVYSPFDDILKPPESGKFSTYEVDSLDVIPVEYTTMYHSLGLNKMFDNQQIYIYETNCSHAQHKDYSCFKQLHEMFEEFCS